MAPEVCAQGVELPCVGPCPRCEATTVDCCFGTITNNPTWMRGYEEGTKIAIKADPALQACRAIVAWFDSERRGPDYGTLDRKTHPEGERIWRDWWESQQNLCDLSEALAREALKEIGNAQSS